MLFPLALLFLFWTSSALAADQNSSVSATRNLFSDLSRLRAHSGDLLGEPFAFADFDGDKQQDIVMARLDRNRYEILVLLSTRSEVAKLSPPVPLSGFTIQACDINKDNFPDVVVTNPAEPYPLAVWLGNGKGEFRIADRNNFKNDFGLAESSGYRNPHFVPNHECLAESWHPVYGKIVRMFGGSELKRHGFINRRTESPALLNPYLPVTSRSPPSGIPIGSLS